MAASRMGTSGGMVRSRVRFRADTFSAGPPVAYVYRADTGSKAEKAAAPPASEGSKAVEHALAVKGVKVVEPAPTNYLQGCTTDQDPDCFSARLPDHVPIQGYLYKALYDVQRPPNPKVEAYKNLTGFDVNTYECGLSNPFCMYSGPKNVVVTGYDIQRKALP